MKANILTPLVYFKKHNKCHWDPWWSPSLVSTVYCRAQHTWVSSSIWARDCFWQDWDRCVDPHWNKVFHEMPNLFHRERDEGSVGCPQWKAIRAGAAVFTELLISLSGHFVESSFPWAGCSGWHLCLFHMHRQKGNRCFNKKRRQKV